MKSPGRHSLLVGLLLVGAAAAVTTACSTSRGAELTGSEKEAIADSLRKLVVAAYDLKSRDPVASLMSLYPREGPVLSASGGVVTTARPALEEQIKAFWTYVGSHMTDPKWEWTSMSVDVLSPDAATMTSTYRVPHLTPKREPHVIGGAWTAVFARRGGRWVIVQEHLSDAPNP